MGKMSSTDRAMLKVAYLLSSINGEIGKLECEAFKTLSFANTGMSPGSKEANDFLIETVTEAEKLQKLKKFYSDKEFMGAFISVIEDECRILREDPIVARKSFAVWMGLCLADGKYSEAEQQLIKILQQIFVRKVDFSNMFWGLPPKPMTIPGFFSPGMKDLFAAQIEKAIVAGRGKADDSEQVISDEFLKELEDDCKMLNDLKMQIDATTDAEQKASLQNSFNYIEDSLKELIQNGLN